MRWSRGTYETILKQYWKGWYSLPPSKLFNYTMMIIFYPMSALNWILAALSCALFLGLGTGLGSALIADGVIVPLELGQLPAPGGGMLWQALGRAGLR